MNTKPARGMRDFLPVDVRRREYVIGVIREVYERYGFEPLETPAVENIETLNGKYGEEGGQLIFKILKRGVHEETGVADLALRYDLTVPLARVVAEHKASLPKFFKRYQIQPVWRADRPARGRFREFYQCDVDALGSRSMVVEAELCAAASDALVALGFNNFTIRLNHRQVLTGVLDAAGVAAEQHTDALVALDKLDKIGREGVWKELQERGIGRDAGERLLSFFESLSALEHAAEITIDELTATPAALNAAILGRLVEFVGDHDAGARGIDELRSVVQFAAATGAGARLKIDPSLARGLSYYTGAIMEINVPDLAGSLGGGGRYDNLVGMFSGQDVPACGFSLGLERIIVVMTEREMFPSTLLLSAAADVLVTLWNEDAAVDALALATEFRAAGLRVDVYPEADKLGKQLKYAAAQNVPFVVVMGEDERVRGEVAVKEMKTGEQQTLERAQVARTLSAKLKTRGQ
ncbi:MAG: histidyl-tRNA synthetase [Blastocatellia bacterium]|jgi:histidyl-tRNA synthetase|nr:histidyl-tRNA synthetase [Blastocatellia bacterium]